MLQITKKTDYALLFLTALAKEDPHEFIPLRRIAEAQNLPYKFLSQIAIELRTAGLVQSKEGLGGGYRLKGLTKDIDLATIIQSTEGPIAPTDCLRGKYCQRAPHCSHKKIMEKLGRVVVDSLSHYSLKDLVAA